MTMEDHAASREAKLASPEIVELVANRLQELRKRLLDSSRRNPLISIPFRVNSTNVFRAVDELPEILRFNLTNGKSMRLVPLPALEEDLPDEQTDEFFDAMRFAVAEDEAYTDALDALDADGKDYDQKALAIERALKDRVRVLLDMPTRQTKDSPSLAEHARAHGISPEYSLPLPTNEHADGRHKDLDIQTLMLPEKLSRIAKGLLEKARGFERETGVNVLHVAFGLLEWKSPGEKDKYISPIALLEIRLERKQSPQGAQFHLSGAGDVEVNTTLKQKLYAEHRLALPEYTSGSVEDFFHEVAKAAPSGWEWKVRREVAIGIFPSSKIAMYHDLDPEKRPVAENPVVGKLLATSGTGDNGYAPVYGTDAPEIACKVPHLVMDADASQFSALVDVADGQNVSIEGPPGSGKSQTIVNLIAAALAGGKRVLFVAEKLTALDVVKNRLEAAGLGEFILPLQSGRGTRDQVYHSLDQRLTVERGNARAHRDYASRQSALERRRQTLQDYLDALGSTFGASGLSVYDVIGHGIATNEVRETIPKDVRRIVVPGCEALDEARIEALVADAHAFAERLGRIDQMPALWIDARAIILSRDDAEDACESLANLADRLEGFAADVAGSAAESLFTDGPFETDVTVLKNLLGAISEMEGRFDPGLVERLTDPHWRRLVQDLCGQVMERLRLIERLGRLLAEPEGWDVTDRLREAQRFAAEAGDRIDPASHRDQIERQTSVLERMQRLIKTAEALPARWAESDVRSLADIHRYATQLLATPAQVRTDCMGDRDRSAERTADLLKQTHSDLATELGRIRQALSRAGDHDEGAMRRAADTIGHAGFFRFLSGDYKAARNTYVNILGGNAWDGRGTMEGRFRTYADWLGRKKDFERDARFSAAFGKLFFGMATDFSRIHKVIAHYHLCNEIAGADEDLRAALVMGDLAPVAAFCTEAAWPDATLTDLRRQAEAKERALDAERRRETDAQALLGMFKDARAVQIQYIRDLLAERERVEQLTGLIERSEAANLIGDRFRGVDTSTVALLIECTLARALSETPDPGLAISLLRSGKAAEILLALEVLCHARDSIGADAAKVAQTLNFDETVGGTAALSKRLEDLRQAAANPSALMERGRMRKSEDTLRRQGFDSLVDWVRAEGEGFDPDRLGPIMRAIIAKSMADRAYKNHGAALQGYDGEVFDRIRAEIVEKDRELIAMSRDVVKNQLIANANPPAGNGIGRKSTFTDMSLIRNEMGKKRNRIGVRELTARAGDALLALKPCWMMSPLAVAQYLHAGLTFDLVVIDEASQMTPENAVGALSRARQAVVVGDTKQLPPTTFFQKMLDDSDTDEDLREDSESVLDMANMAFRPVRQLRWHYRSRHSALIRFSNTWMYDEKLTIFPSAQEDDPDLGVHIKEVDGIYKAGTNVIEARKVVQAVVAQMRDHPDLSLGVCTMNSNQKELIREEFEREFERNQHVQAYVRDWQERADALEEFFIKNLETIQGDERDVMFISTLYGPEILGGRVHQRFGPINSAHGHRRLNVLFTRAKRKIVTFTSLKPTDILAGEEKARGVRMFRAWLEYCASGQVPDRAGAGGESESPFERYVAEQIEAMGCEAVPQVGAAGYRIDIGVRHPDWPYGYILGVECDGASYHSSKSSRDRDRLRQEVLEGLGWRFHRIWSTDWFNDPRSQIERLRDAIAAALDDAKSKPVVRRPIAVEREMRRPEPEGGEALKPDLGADFAQAGLFDAVSAEAAPKPPDEGRAANETAEALANGIVGLGSRVKIESLSDKGRKLAFTIVSEGNDLENGMLGILTPLGQALIDAQEGDEVEYQVGVEIREVRVLEVVQPV